MRWSPRGTKQSTVRAHAFKLIVIVIPAVVSDDGLLVFGADDWSTYYLLHLEVTWAQVYETEPLAGITDPRQQALVLGAEVAKWGETTDASVFDEVVWPRLAAAAEVFWSPL